MFRNLARLFRYRGLIQSLVARELKARYRQGGLGDVTLKKHLDGILQALLAPIRERRARFASEPDYVMGILREGTLKARERTEATLAELRAALGLFTLT